MRVEIEATNLDSGKSQSVVAIFNERELTLYLFEAMMEMQRPADVTLDEALAEVARTSPEALTACRRMANRAMRYFAEQVNKAGREGGVLQ